MDIKLPGVHPDYCIFDLNLKNGAVLHWSCSEAVTHSLVLRGEYGSYPRLDEPLLREIMSSPQRLQSQQEFRLSNGVFCLFLKARELGHAYTLPIVPAAYAIYCAVYDSRENAIAVYQPERTDSDCCAQASAVLRWHSQPIAPPSGLAKLRSKAKQQPAYQLELSKPQHYTEGSVYYSFEGCSLRFPVTAEMLARPFSVQAYKETGEPLVSSSNKGFQVRRS